MKNYRNTKKTQFLLLICLSLFFGFTSCKRPNTEEKPNVVIIFIDDMGYADPSCFGNPAVETPNIDQLANGGLKLTNFYVNSPICSPSRVALNTGCYPMRYGIHSFIAGSRNNEKRAMNNFLDPTASFMAKTLKENGYTTGHFGKWHMGGGRDLGNVPHQREYGFDKSLVSFEGIGDRVLFFNHALSEQSAKLGRGQIIWSEKHRSTSIYVDSALAFIKRNKDKPFYVNLCPNDVHDPHLPSEQALKKFESASENPFERKFYAVLTELDIQLGRFIDSLEEMGVLDNTIILFTSDNGPTDWPWYYTPDRYPDNYTGKLYPPGFTGDYYGRKWSLYEGGIRMPFIAYWKNHIPQGITDSVSVMAAMDIFPSLCSILGIDCPGDLDGTDKSDAILGNPVTMKKPLMWEYSSAPGGSIKPGNESFISPSLAIRDGDYKLLINADSTHAMLFNLIVDPEEAINIIEDEKDKAAYLAHKVLAWRRDMPVAIADPK